MAWKPMAKSPLTPCGASAAVATRHGLAIWGGGLPNNANPATLPRDGAVYDVATDQWTRVPATPERGRLFAGAVVLDSQLMVVGGESGDGDSGLLVKRLESG
jgi:hypothetical protein